MVNHKHYTYRVIWSDEDQEFVGLVAEFPSLSYLHKNQTNALKGIVDLVGQVVAERHGRAVDQGFCRSEGHRAACGVSRLRRGEGDFRAGAADR